MLFPEDLPEDWRGALAAIAGAPAAWSRAESLARRGFGPDLLDALAAAGLAVAWPVPRKRRGSPPIVLWTLTPWGADRLKVMLDVRPISESPYWRDAVEDLADLGPLRTVGPPGQRPLPRADLVPDRMADEDQDDAPADREPVQATDPVTGEPWTLFQQGIPVMVDRRLIERSRRRQARKKRGR